MAIAYVASHLLVDILEYTWCVCTIRSLNSAVNLLRHCRRGKFGNDKRNATAKCSHGRFVDL